MADARELCDVADVTIEVEDDALAASHKRLLEALKGCVTAYDAVQALGWPCHSRHFPEAMQAAHTAIREAEKLEAVR